MINEFRFHIHTKDELEQDRSYMIIEIKERLSGNPEIAFNPDYLNEELNLSINMVDELIKGDKEDNEMLKLKITVLKHG